jgi:hypothetical protein
MDPSHHISSPRRLANSNKTASSNQTSLIHPSQHQNSASQQEQNQNPENDSNSSNSTSQGGSEKKSVMFSDQTSSPSPPSSSSSSSSSQQQVPAGMLRSVLKRNSKNIYKPNSGTLHVPPIEKPQVCDTSFCIMMLFKL